MHLDQFYTNPEVALKYATFTMERFVPTEHQYVEPSAGTGAFYAHLPLQSFGCDLEPKFTGVVKMDYFDFKPELHIGCERPIIVIGNPPFGKNASLAVRFFNHSAQFAKAIAMIVPRTFRKESLVKRLDRNFHLTHEEIVPDHAFIADGEPYDVPCVFQIWEHRDEVRVHEKRPTTHAHFTFVKQADASFAIQRVGVNAGRVKTNVADLSRESHHFIRTDIPAVIEVMQSLPFDQVKYDTAGNPSIGKAEVVALYQAAITTNP